MAARERVQLPLDRSASERWVERCLSELAGRAAIDPLGFSAHTGAWPWAEDLLVTVTLRPTRPPSDSATEAIVSAEAIGQFFDWGVSRRLVRRLCAVPARPVEVSSSSPADDWEKAARGPGVAGASLAEPPSGDFEPVLPRGMTNLTAVLLAVGAVASVVAVYSGHLPSLSTFRERAALSLLFATVLPMLMLGAASRLWHDPPDNYRPGKVQQAINVSIGLPAILIFFATWVWAMVSGIVIVVSFIAGHPVSGDGA